MPSWSTPGLPFHNRTWTAAPAEEGTALVPYRGDQLDRIFALHHERVVGNDNCVEFQNRRWQIPPATLRYSFAKCRVKLYEHLDATLSIGYGPHTLGYYDAQGRLLTNPTIGKQPAGANSMAPALSLALSWPRKGQVTVNNRTDHLLQKPDILTCY